MKLSRKITGTIIGLLLIVLSILVFVIRAQVPTSTPPPLPDIEKSLALPGATSTPGFDEKRPDDMGMPTVTPIPFKVSIDLSKDIPLKDKSRIIVQTKDGEYKEILIAPDELVGLPENRARTLLGLSEGDRIINTIPPQSLMGNIPHQQPPCPVTPYATGRPPDRHTASFTETWYGHEALWAGLSPAYNGTWYAGPQGLKVLWYRSVAGKLTVEGQRLDAAAPSLQADIPEGYGNSGYQASGLVFPAEGCWEVTGRVAGQALRFVVSVHPAAENPIK